MSKHHHHTKNCCKPKNAAAETIKTIVTLPFVALIAVPLWLIDSAN